MVRLLPIQNLIEAFPNDEIIALSHNDRIAPVKLKRKVLALLRIYIYIYV